MATIDRGTIYVARQSFVVWDGGRMLRFRRGRTTIREGHRLLQGREARFEPLTVTHDLVEARPIPVATSGLAAFAALKARARALGLPTSGNKAELEAAIEAAEQDTIEG